MSELLSLLGDAAGSFAKLDGDAVRRSFAGDRSVWSEIGDQGWLSILIPESQGGLGLDLETAAVVARKFGYAALREPFVSGGVMAPICLAGADDASAWAGRLAAVLAGEIRLTVAWQGSRGSLDPEAAEVRARPVDSGVRLDGACHLIPAPEADAFLVLAHAPGGLEFYWVDREACDLVTYPCVDGGAIGSLTLSGLLLPASARVTGAPRAAPLIAAAIEASLIVCSAELLGLMDRALEMTLEHLRTRRQFGVAIGSFQALQHRAVDIWMQKQLTEAAVTAAAQLLHVAATPSAARAAAASGAKARASEAAMALCSQALQLHGAIGFAEEYGLGRYLNRVIHLSSWLGDASHHRQRFGALQESIGSPELVLS